MEDEIDRVWAELLVDEGVVPGGDAEIELAQWVLLDPREFDWRVVDAALDASTCPECGQELGAGPRGCAGCDLADGFRYAAREVDRPGVPYLNEHAIRVSSVVAHNRHRYSARARCGYELSLPILLDGQLPTTAEAQAFKARINRLTPEQLETVTSIAEVVALAP